MCTVTYLPQENDGFILTSNRDESPMRKTIPPKKYVENGVELAYPKDQLAGGTWIGASTKNRLVCLLNGAFKKHVRNSYYKMSRGLVVKNILTVTDAVAYIKGFNFNDIEPFTIILFEKGTLISYATCGMPYAFSGVIEVSGELVKSSFVALRIAFHANSGAWYL